MAETVLQFQPPLPSHRPANAARQAEIGALTLAQRALAEHRDHAGWLWQALAHGEPALRRAFLDLILTEPDPRLAMTDPGLYRRVTRLRTELTLRGWTDLLRRASDAQRTLALWPPSHHPQPIMPTRHPEGLSWKEWLERLAIVGRHLEDRGARATLAIIGSGAVMHWGLEGRTSLDLDAWGPNADFDRLQLSEALVAAGLDFDPKEDEPVRPYLRTVQPGIVLIPRDPFTFGKERLGGLTLRFPAPASLVAAKLTVAWPTDVEDCIYLVGRFGLANAVLRAAIAKLPDAGRRREAGENLVLLGFEPPSSALPGSS